MATHHPHSRLKALRKEIGLTQVDLAARAGVSYPYLLAVETGQRDLSPSLAESIACATGVGPLWLLGTEGKTLLPLTPTGEPYTREHFLSGFGKGERLAKIDPNGEASEEIHQQGRQLTALMRAACRKRRFPVATYFFRKMVTDTVQKLNLNSIYKQELEGLRKLPSYRRREAVFQPLKPRREISFDD